VNIQEKALSIKELPMKTALKLFGVIALVTIIGFSFIACSGGDDVTGGTGGNTDLKGWSVLRDNSSTATETHSIADDGVCTVTIGGTPEKHEDGAWFAWKISTEYAYTGVAGERYEYKFEAWTGSGTRDLHVQYYGDNNTSVYLSETIPITTTRTTYTIYGDALPKSGKRNVSFQLADQLGTVNIKMLEVKEVKIGKLTITNISSVTIPQDAGLWGGMIVILLRYRI